MTLTIADLTSNVSTDANNVVTGDGVFDDLMETVTAHLEAQFQKGRITGNSYAEVYLGALQTTLQQAVQYVLGQEKTNSEVANLLTKTTAEVSLLTQKEVTEWAQTEQTTKVSPNTNSVIGRQNNLYTEQAKGFKWNADQKYLKTLLDAWAANLAIAGVPVTTVEAINSGGVGTDLNDHITNRAPTG